MERTSLLNPLRYAGAIALGAPELPEPVKLGMRAMAKVMTTVAYRV